MSEAEFQVANQSGSNENLGGSEAERYGVSGENATKLLDRAITLYGICLRDYFSTFNTYTTATSILVAAVGFFAGDKLSPHLNLVVASCGLLVCWQWYISTASLRDQYTFFKRRIEDLERQLPRQEDAESLMSRWLGCVKKAREGIKLKDIEDQRLREDVADLNFRFRSLNRPWGMRGTMLPVIYSAVFFAVMVFVLANLTSLAPGPMPSLLSLVGALVWLGGLTIYIFFRGKRRRAKRKPFRRRNGSA